MIATRVAHLRERSGLTMREAARLSGLTQSHVGLIESGRRAHPRDATLKRLASLWGASMSWIAYGEGQPPSDRELKKAVDAARKQYWNA